MIQPSPWRFPRPSEGLPSSSIDPRPEFGKYSATRNLRAKGSSWGLNQISATVFPRYFKAAHCFDAGCSEKLTPRLPDLRTSHPVIRVGEIGSPAKVSLAARPLLY